MSLVSCPSIYSKYCSFFLSVLNFMSSRYGVLSFELICAEDVRCLSSAISNDFSSEAMRPILFIYPNGVIWIFFTEMFIQ